jgi:hypothetical protein
MAKRVIGHKRRSARVKRDGLVAQAKQRNTTHREALESPSGTHVFKAKRAFTKYRPVSASTFVRQRAERFDTAMGSAAGAVRSGRG